MTAFIDLQGRRFGTLTVVAIAPRDGRLIKWTCDCQCGNRTSVLSGSLLAKRTTSCGCVMVKARRAGNNRRHGQAAGEASTALYQCWTRMKSRCDNPNNKSFKYYGGRGITVCDRWRDFGCFRNDMGDVPPGLTIERLDVNGNYEPGNCCWATRREQVLNRRPYRMHGRSGSRHPLSKLSFEAVAEIRDLYPSMTQSALAERYQVRQTTIGSILRRKTWAVSHAA